MGGRGEGLEGIVDLEVVRLFKFREFMFVGF